jgi:hypothetical protein
VPVYAPDLDLLDATRRYVADVHGGVMKRAARGMGVDYAMLRRFLKTGTANPENRQGIRDALEEQGWEIAKQHKIAHEIPVGVTRSMLTQLLQALDAYQGTTSDAQQRLWNSPE